VPLLRGVAGKGVTGASAVISQNRNLVDQMCVLRLTYRNHVANIPDLLGDQPVDARVQPAPQLLPQLRGAAGRQLPGSLQQPRIPRARI
jgi:hypothetical protein